MMNFLKNNKLWLTGDQVMYSGSALLLNLYLAKVMTMYHFGIFASLVVAVYLILSIAQSIIIQPAQVHLTKVKNVNGYKYFLLILLACISFIIVAVGLVIYLLPVDYIESYRPYILTYVAYCIAFIAFDFFRKYFLAEDKVKASFAIQSIYTFSLLVGMVLLSYLQVTSLATVLSVLTLVYLPSLVIALFIYAKGIAIADCKVEPSYYAAHLVDGQWLLYTSIIQWLSSNMYVLMSGMLISIEALGVLRLVQSVFGVYNLYLQMIENHLLPKMAKAFAQSSHACYSLFKSEYVRVLLPGLALLLAVFLFAKEVMTMLGGSAYGQYAMVLQGMCVLYAIILFGYGLRFMVRITGMNKIYFLAYGISLLISLLLYKNLFNNFGVMGAIMGLILNQIILQLTWGVALIQKQYTVWRLYI